MHIEESLIGYIITIIVVVLGSYYGDMLYQYLLDKKDNFNRGDSC